MTFSLYFMMRHLDEGDATISESTESFEFRKVSRADRKELKELCVNKLHKKFPKAQCKDIEDAFDDAVEQVRKSGVESAPSMKKFILRRMEKAISEAGKKKRLANKTLSCVRSVKSSLYRGQSIEDLMSRAEKILTGREMKVIRMCSEGKSVRKIAEEIGTSFPTAWRTLNSALDKIRVSHGIRPRNLDRRGRM